MEASSANPLAVLAFISAPAVLTNASCVLLFGAGNRYARAVDRMHDLAKRVDVLPDLQGEESRLQLMQLQAAEDRALYIVRALTCFYGSAAGFVASTLFGLLGAIATSHESEFSAKLVLGLALIAGSAAVVSMICGAVLLVIETRASFKVLREERNVINHRLRRRAGPI